MQKTSAAEEASGDSTSVSIRSVDLIWAAQSHMREWIFGDLHAGDRLEGAPRFALPASRWQSWGGELHSQRW